MAVAKSEGVLGDGWPYLSDAATVDETLGYGAYRLGTKGIPHLVTWDGACWTDEMLTDAATHQLRLGVDADGLPWMAWGRLLRKISQMGPYVVGIGMDLRFLECRRH